jgi:squalene-hopene/tetraprenyl-beta-curcumene cyclase
MEFPKRCIRIGRTCIKREAKDISRGFTKEPLASQAVGVESVLSALFLAQDEASPKAFDRLWSLQIRDGEAKGAWNWFSLKLDPFEMPESQFYGASLAALAVGSALEGYQKRSEIRENVADLIAYLKREQATQPLHNRLMLVRASTKLPAALPKTARQTIVDEMWRLQQPDGGWTLQSLGPWKTHETAPEAAGSNSYATAAQRWCWKKLGPSQPTRGLSRRSVG